MAFSFGSQIKNSILENIEKIKILFYDNDKYNYTIENIPCHIKQIKINKKKKIIIKKKCHLNVK